MTSIATHERTLLCALAQQVGPDGPTLCGDWDVRDLVVHLLIREGHLVSSAGIFVPPLSGLLDRTTRKLTAEDFGHLVQKLRHGPPLVSPFSIPKLGDTMNTGEFFVHHEDIRRAQPDWHSRVLPQETEDRLWKLTGMLGRGLVLKAPVGVAISRTDTKKGKTRVVLKSAPGDGGVVTVRGKPSEILMFVYGRQDKADVELDGDTEDTEDLQAADLGV